MWLNRIHVVEVGEVVPEGERPGTGQPPPGERGLYTRLFRHSHSQVGVFKTRPFWNPDLKVVSSDGSTKYPSLFK